MSGGNYKTTIRPYNFDLITMRKSHFCFIKTKGRRKRKKDLTFFQMMIFHHKPTILIKFSSSDFYLFYRLDLKNLF